jgi:hypothetical protein
MAASLMLLTATAIQDADAAEPVTRALEVPELASMALLSVVLAGVSMAVRRVGSRSARQRRAQPPPTAAGAEAPATTSRAQSSPSGS